MRELETNHEINRGLLGFWPLDATGGMMQPDLSPQQMHARGVNAVGRYTSKLGASPYFSGPAGASTPAIKIGNRLPIGSLQFPLTIAGWVRRASSTGWRPIFTQYGTYSAGRIVKVLHLNPSHQLRYATTHSTATEQAQAMTATVPQDEWAFVAVTVGGSFTGPTVRLYLNRTYEQFTYAALRSSITTTDNVYIASHAYAIENGGSSEGFTGLISNMRIWARDLSQQEMRRLYADPWIGTRRRPPRVWYLPSAGAYTLTAEHGTINLTGQAVALTAARKMVPEHGSIALTGQDVSLPVARKMVPEHGAIALTGQDVGLTHGYNLIAEHGEIILTGQDVDLTSTGSEPEVATPTGGDDAPARRADVERLGRLRRRHEREQEDRQRRLRESIEAAYAAAQGLPAKPSREDRAPLREAVAEAAAVATPEVARDVARLEQMAATLRTARHVKRLIQELQALRARLRKEDDAMTVLLMVM